MKRLVISVISMLVLAGTLLVVSVNGQVFTTEGIVNAANFRPEIAAQSIASLFGTGLSTQTCAAVETPLPVTMCGVSVVFWDAQGSFASAPLFFVSPEQINFQVPIAWGSLAICVNESCESVLVELQAPAIFEYQRELGVFDPIITHANGSLVTPESPAVQGETLILYATGMGVFDFQTLFFPQDGESVPLNRLVEFNTVWIRIAEEIVPVLFAGLAPGFVGLAQFNFKVEREGDNSFRFPSGPLPLYIDAAVGKSKTVSLYVE